MTADIAALRGRIENRTATVGVVGLGYVGLPVACVLADVGFAVVGVDLDADRAATIKRGRSPIEGDEPGLEELLSKVIDAKRLRSSTSHHGLADADVVLVCVETPVDADHRPRFAALTAACAQLGAVLKDGALVIIESTIAPGTIDNLVRPALDRASQARDAHFFVGHCPERVMPGKLLRNMRTMSRVCGGSSPEVSEAMVALYSTFVDADLDPADCLTAELVKTAENAYRDVGIAFANQLALICEVTGGDVWKVRELVNKSPGRDVLFPGGGVGGHCIPKDPWLLAAPLGEGADESLLGVARRINDGMPGHVADLVAQFASPKNGSRVAILGYAYLQDTDDTRNSPSRSLLEILTGGGYEVTVHDPFVQEFKGDVMEALRGADCAVLMVAHKAYRDLDLREAARQMRHPTLVDARAFFTAKQLGEAGFQFRTIGVGKPDRSSLAESQ